jgi:hypothetical protein
LAVEQGKEIIDETLTDKVAQKYSDDKVEDMETEFQAECENIKTIINSFSECDFEMSAENLRKHLEKIPSICSVAIRGEVVANDKPETAFILWKFLHEVGFINARVPDAREKRDFRHVTFDDDQNFVSKSNWGEMQKCIWDIHPAYRSHLLKLKMAEKYRMIGKAKKGK